jgi:uncharacterized RmlC-like cupin family protein
MNSAIPRAQYHLGMADCKLIRTQSTFEGKQGFSYFEGISAESVGSQAVCMHLLEIPPGARAHVHLHEGHETAIYVLEGVAEMLYGDQLEHHMVCEAGCYVYIPAGVPHVPWNPSKDKFAKGVIARTDPNEQESVVLCPHLEPIVEAFLAKQTSECPA